MDKMDRKVLSTVLQLILGILWLIVGILLHKENSEIAKSSVALKDAHTDVVTELELWERRY